MIVPHSTQVVFLSLSAFFFRTKRCVASASTVPPSARLCAFDTLLKSAFQRADELAGAGRRLNKARGHCLRYSTAFNRACSVSH